jgi:hypothetical protein
VGEYLSFDDAPMSPEPILAVPKNVDAPKPTTRFRFVLGDEDEVVVLAL